MGLEGPCKGLLQQNLEIASLARLLRWEAAFEVIRAAVPAAGLQPDQITYGAAGSACQRVGGWLQGVS